MYRPNLVFCDWEGKFKSNADQDEPPPTYMIMIIIRIKDYRKKEHFIVNDLN